MGFLGMNGRRFRAKFTSLFAPLLVASGLAGVLAGCGGLTEGTLFNEDFWVGGPTAQNNLAELGMAEMAKGNHVAAERKYKTALRRNPRDVHALLGLGLLYQNTGQLVRSREMYEAVLAIRPPKNQQLVVWESIKTRPISEIASVNLALIESGGVLSDMGRRKGNGAALPQAGMMSSGVPGADQAGGYTGGAVSGAQSPSAMIARGAARGASGTQAAIKPITGGTVNVVTRFDILNSLRKQGLLTQAEFDARRQANIGALLPLTSPPPAAGLDRPVPTAAQISGRLRAIARGLEMRAITISQHAAERTMILNALMPAAPVTVANPGPPPRGLMEAADAVRELEYLKDQGFITSDEYTKEREAVERAMQPAQPKMSSQPQSPFAMKPQSGDAGALTLMKSTGPQPAIHLASYRTKKQAERGWNQLRKAHRKLLGKLDPEITRTNLGSGKGTFYRLKAGPLTSEANAKKLCGKLKNRRQYCEPTVMDNG